jgi:zinc protease
MPLDWSLTDISFTRAILDNGLTVIVHQDRKVPIVAVNICYHVGSKNERPDKTGLAHLFEHLMYSGTEHYRGSFLQPLEQAGATTMNGTTNEDFTNYFQTVPKAALEMVLWMESDRMGHLLGAIDQAKLDLQREVIRNEKHQRESEPYGRVGELVSRNTYPGGHPYSWPAIGSMEDLESVGLEEIGQWFRDYYGAANAVVVIAGDVDPEGAIARVKEYFSDIPSGPPVTRQRRWIAKMDGIHRAAVEDTVAQSRIYKIWNIPDWTAPDHGMLSLAVQLLAGGKASRLYKHLVYREQIATDVACELSNREIGSQFMVQATARPGVALKGLEAALDNELEQFLRAGPDPEELKRARTAIFAGFVRNVERVGGFNSKSAVLSLSELFAGRPDGYRSRLERIAAARPDDVREAAECWLGDGVFALEVDPFPNHKTHASAVDRRRLPAVGATTDFDFPALHKTALANGLKIVVAERHETPLVSFRLVLEAGFATDRPDRGGLAGMTVAMLNKGTVRRDALRIAEELQRLGAETDSRVGLDTATAGLCALASNLAASLDLYAEFMLQPAFVANEFARLKRQRIAAIRQEKTRPMDLALRVMPPLIYGDGHPYSQPMTGSGTEASLESLLLRDLVVFHRAWFRPDLGTLVVAGDTKMETLLPLLEASFNGWTIPAEAAPSKAVFMTPRRAGARIFVIDQPGAQQSAIFAAQTVPPKNAPEATAIAAANALAGEIFTSRLNMNLREDKHWTYGARSFVLDARGERPFLVHVSVQRDKTAAAIHEMRRELQELGSGRPVEREELERVQANLTLKLPGSHETSAQIARGIENIVTYGLGDDYYRRFVGEVRALAPQEIEEAARRITDAFTWLVLGDLSVIRHQLHALGLGPVQMLDCDGHMRGEL